MLYRNVNKQENSLLTQKPHVGRYFCPYWWWIRRIFKTQQLLFVWFIFEFIWAICNTILLQKQYATRSLADLWWRMLSKQQADFNNLTAIVEALRISKSCYFTLHSNGLVTITHCFANFTWSYQWYIKKKTRCVTRKFSKQTKWGIFSTGSHL